MTPAEDPTAMITLELTIAVCREPLRDCRRRNNCGHTSTAELNPRSIVRSAHRSGRVPVIECPCVDDDSVREPSNPRFAA